MPSLKTKLLEVLQQNHRLSLNELESLCKREQYKLSNAERRFRELMSPTHTSYNPSVKPEKNSAGAIISYCWQNPAPQQTITPKLDKPLTEVARAFLARNLNEWHKEPIKENLLF